MALFLDSASLEDARRATALGFVVGATTNPALLARAGHTDARSDIYAFGATLYHLLTNQAPVEARERFLNPESLIPPRQANPNLGTRTERAIYWAMNLHPDERPQDIESFRQALLGNWTPPVGSTRRQPTPSLRGVLRGQREQVLAWVAAGLLAFSLITTIFR